MKYKYATVGKKQRGSPGHGRYVDPDRWVCGPDPWTRELYYAFLKHRAQANYRGEDYSLTWEQWQDFWTKDTWDKRGRLGTSLVLGRINWHQGWHKDNCAIMTRKRHFEIKKEHNARS